MLHPSRPLARGINANFLGMKASHKESGRTPLFKKGNAFRHLEKLTNPAKFEHFLEMSKAPSIPPPLQDTRRPVHVDLSHHMNIKKGDLVQVLYGADAGRQGVVRSLVKKKNCVIVQGMSMKKTFRVSTAPGEDKLCNIEMPIHITNVAPVDPVIKKPTRIKRRYTMFGECVRISKVSGCAMPAPVEIKTAERERLHNMHEFQARIHKKYKGVEKEPLDKKHYQMLAKIAYASNLRGVRSRNSTRAP